jgi:hypothetical protein
LIFSVPVAINLRDVSLKIKDYPKQRLLPYRKIIGGFQYIGIVNGVELEISEKISDNFSDQYLTGLAFRISQDQGVMRSIAFKKKIPCGSRMSKVKGQGPLYALSGCSGLLICASSTK